MARFVLDTCVVRNYLHQNGPQLDLAKISANLQHYEVSVASQAAVEMMAALIEGRIPWSDWTARIGDINAMLDPRMPMLPDGNELAFMAGLTTTRPAVDSGTLGYHYALWNHLIRCTSEADLEQHFTFRDENGQSFGASMTCANAIVAAEEERDRWIQWFRRAETDLAEITDKAERRSRIRENLRGEIAGRPELNQEGIEPSISVLARFVDLMSGRSPYNPESEKRRGDVFDFGLVYALALPATVVTADGRLQGHIRLSGHPDQSAVLMTEEFNALVDV